MEITPELLKAQDEAYEAREAVYKLNRLSFRIAELDNFLFKKTGMELTLDDYEVLRDAYKNILDQLRSMVINK